MIAPKDNTPIDMPVATETPEAATQAEASDTMIPTDAEGTPNAPKETAPAKAQMKRIHFVNNGNGQSQRFTICVNIQPGRKAVMRLGPGSSARLVKAVSESQADEKKKESVTKWAHEISILKELGFKKTRTCEVYLVKTKGDVGKAAEMMFLQRRKNEKKAKEEAKKAKEEAKKAKAADAGETSHDAKEKEILDKQALLESRGFTCKRVTRNLLNRFDGDVEKVAALLTKRKAAKQAKAAALAAANAEKTSLVEEKQAEEKKTEEKAGTVKVTTFDEKALREQLMKRFNGDEEKVSKIMSRRTEQAKAKQEAKKKMMAAKQKAKQEMRAKKQAAKEQKNAVRRMPQPVMMANPNHMLIA